MANKMINLINVKSIVTIILTIVFAYLAIIGQINSSDYLTIYTVIIAFYFGTQYKKGEKNE